jgi:hypothetical protein
VVDEECGGPSSRDCRWPKWWAPPVPWMSRDDRFRGRDNVNWGALLDGKNSALFRADNWACIGIG